MATTFSLKQGETTTSHGPIPHPLRTAKPYKNEKLGRTHCVLRLCRLKSSDSMLIQGNLQVLSVNLNLQ